MRQRQFIFSEEGYELSPNKLYLGHTEEVMGSNFYVPIIRGRSSIGRLGLFIHITADLIDIGSINQWTLQMHCVQPVTIYPGMLIGQVTFWRVEGAIIPYNGKYQGSRGPMASQIHLDMQELLLTNRRMVSLRPVWRFLTSSLCTAMASAFFVPMRKTHFFPRVRPV